MYMRVDKRQGHGREATDTLAMPYCADCMQGLTRANYSINDQHKDLFTAWKERDHKDTHEIVQYLRDYSPFVS